MKQTVSGLQNWPLPIWSAKDWVLGGAFVFHQSGSNGGLPPPSSPLPQQVKREVGREWGWVGVVWGRRTGL